MAPKTYVYIDAFNLYFGALKGTPHRWLDLKKMCALYLPKNDIRKIKYFTSLVKPRPSDPTQPSRQNAYLRALKTIPEVEIQFGHFMSHPTSLPLESDPTQFARVIKTGEKGSDVNLAVNLVADAFRNEFEVAVVISNDSDLAESMRIVRELGKPVGLLNPQRPTSNYSGHPSSKLLAHASFYKPIRAGVIAGSQFPPAMTDGQGQFTKPASW